MEHGWRGCTGNDLIERLEALPAQSAYQRETIKQAISALRRQAWVSVDERLPEEGEEVDIFDSVFRTRVPDCYLDEGGDFVSEYVAWSGQASHWRYPPEPPQGSA